MRHLFPALLALAILAPAPALLAEVKNPAWRQAGILVEITYDLESRTPATVSLKGSANGGRTWFLKVEHLSGAVGEGVQPGPGKVIWWDVLLDYPQGLEIDELTFEIRAQGGGALPSDPEGLTSAAEVTTARPEGTWEVVSLEVLPSYISPLAAQTIRITGEPGGMLRWRWSTSSSFLGYNLEAHLEDKAKEGHYNFSRLKNKCLPSEERSSSPYDLYSVPCTSIRISEDGQTLEVFHRKEQIASARRVSAEQ